MSKAARSLYVWSFYALAIGASFALAPNFVLSTLGLPEVQDDWIARALGLVVTLLALYYWDAARNEARHHFVASVLGRGFVAAGFLVLVATGEPWQLLIFAAVDLVGVTWTVTSLRADAEG